MPTPGRDFAPILPDHLTSEVQAAFDALPRHPTSQEIEGILVSDAAKMLVDATLADIGHYDNRFALSGTGGFYHSLVAKGNAGRIKLHLFAPPDICEGEEAPHTHKSKVVPAVHRGTVINTLYGFEADPGGEMIANSAPVPETPPSNTPLAIGNLATLSSDVIQGDASGGATYAIELGQIHSSQTDSGHAVTLCYFGPQIEAGIRFARAGNPQAGEPARGILYRPSDLVRQ